MIYTFEVDGEKRKKKEEICYFMERVYSRGLTTSLGGNISMRYGSIMLITPSSIDKANLKADDIAEVDIATGENLTAGITLSIESGMHRAIYLSRVSAKAAIHAHCPYATVFSSAKDEILCDIIQESYYQLSNMKKCAYALMGSPELAHNVGSDARYSDVLLMENHGVLALSDGTLLEALEKLECLENAAKMSLFREVVSFNRLSDSQKKEIDQLRKK